MLKVASAHDQAGNKRYTTEIVADTLQLLGRRPEGQSQQGGYNQGYQQAQPAYQQPAQQPGFQQPAYQQPQPAAQANPMADDQGVDDLPF